MRDTMMKDTAQQKKGNLKNHKVLLAGIDGSGKSSCLDALIERLEPEYSVTKVVNKDGSIYRNGQLKLIFRRFFEMVEGTRDASQKYNFYSIFLAIKFMYKLLVVKNVLRRPVTDLTMFEIDLLLHPSVYMTYHFPRFCKWVNARTRFRIMSKLTGASPEFSCFYLEADPEVSMERIRKRGIHIAAHENVEDLRKLKEEFDRVIDVASSCGYRVVRVNTNDKNLAQVTDEIESILSNRLSTAA